MSCCLSVLPYKGASLYLIAQLFNMHTPRIAWHAAVL